VSNAERGDSPIGLRFVDDADGVEWTIWEVKPSLRSVSGASATSLPNLSDTLRDGWLTFQNQMERRRVAPAPAGWHTMSDAELLRMLSSARAADRRGRLIE
jgi:hypothetical protein